MTTNIPESATCACLPLLGARPEFTRKGFDTSGPGAFAPLGSCAAFTEPYQNAKDEDLGHHYTVSAEFA